MFSRKTLSLVVVWGNGSEFLLKEVTHRLNKQSLREEMALEVEWSGARIDHGGNKGHHIIIPGDYEFRIRREIRTLINLVHFLRAIYVDFKPKVFQRR